MKFTSLPPNKFAQVTQSLWTILVFVLPFSLVLFVVLFVLYYCFFTSFAGRNRFPRYLDKSTPLAYNTSARILDIKRVLSGDGRPTLTRQFLTHEQIHEFCLNFNPPADSTFRRSRAQLQRLAEGSQVECSADDRNLQNPFDRYHFFAVVQ